MAHMLDEIREQPAVLSRISGESARIGSICKAIRERDIRLVYIAARGTSDHAAHYAKYLFEIEHAIPVGLAAASTYTLYRRGPKLDSQTLVIGISQSGAGPDVCAVVENARASGALTLAITNTTDSRLATAAEFTEVTPAGPELSVAATKTYTSAMGVIAFLSATLAQDDKRLSDLVRLPSIMQSSLALSAAAEAHAAKLETIENCVVLGRGYNYATALETALKLTETCSIGAQPFSSADFLHGPIARIALNFPCFLIAAEGEAFPSMVDMAKTLRERGASLTVVTSKPKAFDPGDTFLTMPAGIPEWLSPIAYIVAGQLFAYHLSIAKGRSPDTPQGLTKVTQTI